MPQDWKIASVSPIFKKKLEIKQKIIGLTSNVCKLMESFAKESIMIHMRVENL